MNDKDDPAGHQPCPLLGLGSSERLGHAPERADVAAVMALVWALVRSGPNFDGRQCDVQRAVAAAIDNAVAAERERWLLLLTEKWHAGDGKGQTLAQYMGMTDAEYSAWVFKA